MADVRVAVTKSLPFQGRTEEFSNVYHYKNVVLEQALLDSLANAVVNAERLVHDVGVTFKHVRVWDAGNPPNHMHISKPLTGTGSASNANVNVYRETALLFRWPLPSRQGLTRTIRRSLRKYIHTASLPTGMGPAGQDPGGTITTGDRFDQYRNIIKEPTAGVLLCAPNGDEPTAPMNISPYLEHRQFPRGRKES